MESCVRRERENIWAASKDTVPTPTGNEIFPIVGSVTYLPKNEDIISSFYGLLGTTFIPQQRVLSFPNLISD